MDEIDIDEVVALLRGGNPPLLIDVREPKEHAAGVLEAAHCVPLATLVDRAPGLIADKGSTIVVYCASGMRSAAAVRDLAAIGLPNARSMRGGFIEWQKRELPWTLPTEPVADTPTVDPLARYARQWRLPEVGVSGQRRLLAARVLSIGAGGLGSPASLYLAAAGIGTLGIVDSDHVELSNLHRQVVHTTDRIGEPKVTSAAKTLQALNPDCRVVPHTLRVTADNAAALFAGYDVIVDGSDNVATRYVVNDAAMQLGKPVVYGAVLRFEGQVAVFAGQPCYRCLFPKAPPAGASPSCEEAGVIGVVPGVIGVLQAAEVVKLILGVGETLGGRMVTYDALSTRFTELEVAADPDCPACGRGKVVPAIA